MAISEVRKRELQKTNLLILAKHKEPKFTDKFFPYTSGEIGPYFIQSLVVVDDGEDYHTAINSTAELAREVTGGNFDAISGGESRDWDFSNPVAYALKKPHIKLYKDPVIHPPIGIIKDKRIVHVADLQNEGSSFKNSWAPLILGGRGNLVHAIFYVDRIEDGVKVMKELNVPSDAVVPLDGNAWQILMDVGYITRAVYESLNSRMEDKKAWAHASLRTNMDHLEALLRDPKSRAKAEKNLNVGYPEIKDELLDRLKAERGYVHRFLEEKK